MNELPSFHISNPPSKAEVMDLAILEQEELAKPFDSNLPLSLGELQERRRQASIKHLSDDSKSKFYQYWQDANDGLMNGSRILSKPNRNTLAAGEIGSLIVVGIIVVIACIVLYLFTKEDSPEDIARDSIIAIEADSVIAVKAILKDPDSAQFQNIHGICGEVNSKNGFGGMTGFKRYIGNSGMVAIEGENMDRHEFQSSWIEHCL